MKILAVAAFIAGATLSFITIRVVQGDGGVAVTRKPDSGPVALHAAGKPSSGSAACPGENCILTESALRVEGCPGPRCVLNEEQLVDARFTQQPPLGKRRGRSGQAHAGRGGGRRRRKSEQQPSTKVAIAEQGPPSSTPPAAVDAATSRAPPAGFELLRPLSPLPRAYALHLEYMRVMQRAANRLARARGRRAGVVREWWAPRDGRAQRRARDLCAGSSAQPAGPRWRQVGAQRLVDVECAWVRTRAVVPRQRAARHPAAVGMGRHRLALCGAAAARRRRHRKQRAACPHRQRMALGEGPMPRSVLGQRRCVPACARPVRLPTPPVGRQLRDRRTASRLSYQLASRSVHAPHRRLSRRRLAHRPSLAPP
jgi:hypothetical protein